MQMKSNSAPAKATKATVILLLLFFIFLITDFLHSNAISNNRNEKP
eukprot:gene4104-2950_t